MRIMRKIQIDEFRPAQYYASFKARIDCRKILSELGFEECNLEPYIKERSKVHNFMVFFRSLAKTVMKLMFGKGVVAVQYPLPALYNHKNYIYRIIFGLYRGKIVVLVHDLEHIRNKYSVYKDKDLTYLLDRADYIILHTENMKQKLLSEFDMDKDKIKILGPFDYLCDDEIKIDDTIKGNRVIFAGNLTKSGFIYRLGELKGTEFNLYGVIDNKDKLPENCSYKGFFDPNRISSVEGDWGLVWDGDSTDGCTGHLGEYLKYNSSHKFSLYLAAGFPVIVWGKSALSKFVKENRIGIAVDSLKELEAVFKSMGEEERKEIKTNVKNWSCKVRNGYNIKTIVEEILNNQQDRKEV